MVQKVLWYYYCILPERKEAKHIMTCRFWISIAVVPVLLTGCISPGRMADLGDCGTFGIGFGQGLDATLRLGALSEASLGIGHRINYFGWDDRGDIDYYEPFQWSWPFSTVSYGIFSALLGRPCGLTPNDSFCFEPMLLGVRVIIRTKSITKGSTMGSSFHSCRNKGASEHSISTTARERRPKSSWALLASERELIPLKSLTSSLVSLDWT